MGMKGLSINPAGYPLIAASCQHPADITTMSMPGDVTTMLNDNVSTYNDEEDLP